MSESFQYATAPDRELDDLRQRVKALEAEVEALRSRSLHSDGAPNWLSLANAMPQFVWVAQSFGDADFINDYWFEYTGLPKGDYSQATYAKAIHPADLQRIVGMWEEAFSSGTERRFEYRVRRASDGTWRWHLGFHRPERNPSGEIVRWVGTAVEIHDWKLAQEELRKTEERQRLALEAGAIGLWDWDIQTNRVVWSDRIYELHGLPPGTFGGTVEAFSELIHPGDRERIGTLLQKALQEGELYNPEFRAVHPDGSVRWLSTRAHVLRDGQGRAIRMMGATLDITEQKRVEASLRENEERFRAIVETTPECVKLVTADGVLLQMNASGLAMVEADSAEEIAGRSVYDLIAPEFREDFRRFNQRICGGQRGSLQYDLIGLHGRRRRMETHAAPLRWPDGTVVQLAITRDITERLESERATLLLGAIVDSSDDAIVSKDLNGIITSWNKGAQQLFGYSEAEAVGKSITIIIPSDRLNEETEILRRLRSGQRIEHVETIRRRKDGTLVDVSLTISPVKDSQGRIMGASKIARDISGRKQAEKAIQALNVQMALDLSAMTRMQQISTRLLQADDFQQLLGEIVDAGIEITGADMGNIQLLEDGLLKIEAHRGFEARFLDFFEIVREGEAVCKAALDAGRRVIVDDVAGSAVFADSPVRQVLLDAQVRAVQSTPLISRSGRILGVFSTHYRAPRRPDERELRLLDILARQATDLIERKRAEAALLASESRFRQLADAMPQIVWTAGPDGQLDYYNERWYELTGFARDPSTGSSWTGIFHPDDFPRCRETWYASVRGGEPYAVECRLWDRHEGRWRWFMARALPVRDPGGRIVKWFGTSTDIDEQKRVEEELRRANLDLEQFAYSASHDLQEPLRTISIYGELLSRRYGSKLEGEALEFLNFLRTGATRMEGLVRDLLAYTQVMRIDTAGPVSAGDALAHAIANLSGAIAESGAVVSYGPLPSVRVHATHLQQLFQNLVGNALKYRNPGRKPEIHVSAEHRGKTWLFSVRDNGIGIRPEYTEQIFGLFKRLHTSEEYSGTGIGLAICQRIVERYHGRIWVESVPEEGSTFVFAFPD